MNGSNVTVFRVGKPLYPDRTSWPQGVQFSYRGGNLELVIFNLRPSESEIAGVNGGLGEFALVPYHGALFFLYKLGKHGQWSDAPYSWWLVPEEERIPPPSDLAADSGAPLQLRLVDCADGILRAQALLNLPPGFTRALFSEIRRQIKGGWGGREVHERQVRQAYEMWPTPRKMLPTAIAKCSFCVGPVPP
jgi:hypothetical protein